MNARAAALGAIVVGVIAVAVLIATGGNGDDYKVRLQMANAEGLREGRAVKIGGAKVGTIEKIDLVRGDAVEAVLALDPKDGPIGRGATATIKPTNLLGEKFVELEPGDKSAPAPSGVVIPRSRVTGAVDLDQVLNVLDADTRTRLAILLNEAGLALSGRKADFASLLEQLPPSLEDFHKLLSELVSDNQTLGLLIDRGQRFVSHVTPERRQLSRMVGSAGETMRTLAAKRIELRDTVRRAPAALSTLRGFLADLRQTTRPLGPAARAITATSPSLTSTLSALEPFRKSAEPTLDKATQVAPTLARLSRATPVLRRSNPTLRALRDFARTAEPVIAMLGHGTGGKNTRTSPGAIDDLLATMHEWAQTIQTRDGLSHVFRGWLNFTPDQFRQLVERLSAPAKSKSKSRKGREQRPADEPAKRSDSRAPTRPEDVVRRLIPELKRALPEVKVPGLKLPEAPKTPSLDPLLDFLLK